MVKETNNHVTNEHFDISGLEISRIGKHVLISRMARYENLSGGPGWKSTLFLWGIHNIGRWFGKENVIIDKIIKKYLNR